MDNFLKQMFPKDAERWIKVKYIDPEKAMQVIRFNRKESFNNNHLGIEILNIGVVEEYMPQIEALVELKAEFETAVYTNFLDPNLVGVAQNLIDNKIQQVLERTLISKR